MHEYKQAILIGFIALIALLSIDYIFYDTIFRPDYCYYFGKGEKAKIIHRRDWQTGSGKSSAHHYAFRFIILGSDYNNQSYEEKVISSFYYKHEQGDTIPVYWDGSNLDSFTTGSPDNRGSFFILLFAGIIILGFVIYKIIRLYILKLKFREAEVEVLNTQIEAGDEINFIVKMTPRQRITLNQITASLDCKFNYSHGKQSNEILLVDNDMKFMDEPILIEARENYEFSSSINIPKDSYSNQSFRIAKGYRFDITWTLKIDVDIAKSPDMATSGYLEIIGKQYEIENEYLPKLFADSKKLDEVLRMVNEGEKIERQPAKPIPSNTFDI